MAIKIGGTTIIDDSRVLINTGNVGVGTTNPSSSVDVSNISIVHAGIVTANFLYGDGSGLTGVAGIGTDGSVNTTGIITASSFTGDGSNLTNLPGGGGGIGTDGSVNTTGIITASSFVGN